MNKLQKNVLTLIGVFLCMNMAVAQRTAIKANILSPIVATGSFFVEHALSDESSLQLGVFYTGASIEDTKFRGFGITPEFRYYLSEEPVALSGFYLAPFLGYRNFSLTVDNSSDEAKFESFGGGLLVGHQWLLKERITLDLFIGPKYSGGRLTVDEGSEESFDLGVFDGFGVRAGITLGVAF